MQAVINQSVINTDAFTLAALASKRNVSGYKKGINRAGYFCRVVAPFGAAPFIIGMQTLPIHHQFIIDSSLSVGQQVTLIKADSALITRLAQQVITASNLLSLSLAVPRMVCTLLLEQVYFYPMEPSTQPALRTRRSLLFMPGDSMRKIEKATQLPVDSIVMDLEDGVARNRKATGRQTIVEALQTLAFGPREKLIRINPVGEQLWDVDLEATVQAQPDGYVLPKVEYANDLLTVDQYLTEVERRNNWPLLSIRLLALVETARGVMNLREIAAASSRLDALAIGAEDLAGDIGATRTSHGWEVFYARSALVTAAAAFGLQAIDTVFVDLNDLVGLRLEAEQMQQMGFMGKLAIHPRQVEVINEVFTPSAAEVAQARRLIQSFEEHQAAGDGAFELDGKMVDAPMMKAARRVLARADFESSP